MPERCQNCLATEIMCRVSRELDRRACCTQCEHVTLETPDAVSTGR